MVLHALLLKSILRSLFAPIRKLNVFFNGHGILRVRSRLVNSSTPYDTKYQILLPRRHKFVGILIRKFQIDPNHFRWSYVLAKLRTCFWVIRGQSTIHDYLDWCVYCQIRNAEASSQTMTPLRKEGLFVI